MTKAGRERRKAQRMYATRHRKLRAEVAYERRLQLGRAEIHFRSTVYPPQMQRPLTQTEQDQMADAIDHGFRVGPVIPQIAGSERNRLLDELLAGAMGVQAQRRALGFA